MPAYALIVPVLFPMLAGSALMLLRLKSRKLNEALVFASTLITTLFVFALLFWTPKYGFTPLHFFKSLTFGFRMDGLSKVFSALVAALWPLAVLYAFDYMKNDPNPTNFYALYTITYGATLGIALSRNLLTLYVFYEVLTLVTLPLVMHGLSHEAVHAGRKYLYYMLGGSAFAFIGLIFIMRYAGTTEFVAGGALVSQVGSSNRGLLLVIYLLTFLGFSVKAAMFPLHDWLPTAAVAPTPVTALLHAVAVVKAGGFAILRVTYFCFGVRFLQGTWVQYLLMGLTAFSIVFGSSMSLKEQHLKRRLAYSTVANLSYILFGATLLSPAGLAAALYHMIAHAVTKISSFYCAGTMTQRTGRQYVWEIDGIGRKMPVLFTCFTISALSLTGIPLFAGFVSKWMLATSAVVNASATAYAGIGALLLSALLTAMYMFPVCIHAFFPRREAPPAPSCSDPGWRVLLPVALCSFACIVFGVFAQPLSQALLRLAGTIV